MSVYTNVKTSDIESFLSEYKITLICATPIKKGTVNSNYYLRTSLGDFILTIFESMGVSDINNIFSLTHQLHNFGIKCPTPIPDLSGGYINPLANKPASLISVIHGEEPMPITIEQSRTVGQWLANMHYNSDMIRMPKIENPMGIKWRESTFNKLKEIAPANEIVEFSEVFAAINPISLNGASTGFCHCDLFPDNSLFTGNKLNGVIDFYYSCTEAFIYDLAICVNAWCFCESGEFFADKYHAMIEGYQQTNPLNQKDIELWPSALKLATLRFWLSRLYSKYSTTDHGNISIKDPDEIRNIMRFHQDNKLSLSIKRKSIVNQ